MIPCRMCMKEYVILSVFKSFYFYEKVTDILRQYCRFAALIATQSRKPRFCLR
jgi:hypothetical protein